MTYNLIVLGLFFDIVGVLILVSMVMIHPTFNKNEIMKWYTKRYSYSSPSIYKKNGSLKIGLQWNQGYLPPVHIWNLFGVSLIITGFILQIIGNLT